MREIEGKKDAGKDLKNALEWRQEAAAHGDAEAQYLLGRMYADGHGVSKDDFKAYVYYLLVKAGGSHLAENMEEKRLENALTPAEQEQARNEAMEMWEKIQKKQRALTRLLRPKGRVLSACSSTSALPPRV
jgi:TPR repeat protein